MAKKIKYWNTTCYRFVAFLDIMGFRERVFIESHEDVKKMIESLRPAIENIEKSAISKDQYISRKEEGIGRVIKLGSVFPVSFSDSIIIISNDDSRISAFEVFRDTGRILSKAISSGIPMKGAIAYGEMTADLDNSIYFGKPLIYAYELQNELHLYGIVLHHTIEKRLNFMMIEEPDNYKYTVPIKSGKISHYLVDWTQSIANENEPIDLVTKLYHNVSGEPRIYIDNTIVFLNWLKEAKNSHKKRNPNIC